MTLIGREKSTYVYCGSVALGSDIRTVALESYTNQFCYNLGGGAIPSHYSPPLGEWLHLAVTIDRLSSSQIALSWFINGVKHRSETWGADPQTDILTFTIGSSFRQPSPHFFFNGFLDDVRIYSRVLSSDEVKALYVYERGQVPSLTIEVKTVQVTMFVTVGKTYQLQSSTDLVTWTNLGAPFLATSPEVSQIFDVTQTGQFFRLKEVQ